MAGTGPHGLCLPSRHCLSQQDCLCVCGCYWKDLTCLGRDLAKTVALDHTVQGVTTQVPPVLALGGAHVHQHPRSTAAPP